MHDLAVVLHRVLACALAELEKRIVRVPDGKGLTGDKRLLVRFDDRDVEQFAIADMFGRRNSNARDVTRPTGTDVPKGGSIRVKFPPPLENQRAKKAMALPSGIEPLSPP
jgi:hypothetical protein